MGHGSCELRHFNWATGTRTALTIEKEDLGMVVESKRAAWAVTLVV